MSQATSSHTVVQIDDVVSHPSYVPCYAICTPGDLGKDVTEVKAVLNYEDLVYAVVVTKEADVVLWQAHLPLARKNLAWTTTPIITGPTPRLEVDFLCVLHDAAIWVLPVNSPKVVFVFKLGQGNERQGIGHWNRYTLHGEAVLKVARASSFGSGHGIYIANDTMHGILDTNSCYIKPFDSTPNALVDDCFVIGSQVFGGDNGNLYRFQQGNWQRVLEAPKASFWAMKGTVIYCFIKAKEHGKPLQVALQYTTNTGITDILDCDFVMPGETPFPYEIPSPIISHGPYFYFFTEDIKAVYTFDVFTFFPYEPLHCQWRQFVNSPKFSDIAFSVAGRTFHGHKVLLSCYEYFARLIGFPSQESVIPGPQVINMEDISPEAFEQLLHFLYCGRLQGTAMTTNIAIELLFAASKYLLPGLAHKCSERLAVDLDGLGLGDTITVLETAYNVDESGPLFKKAVEVLLERYPDFMAQPEFIQMATHNLDFYKKILRISMQFMTLDKAKLACKANCSLTFE